MRASVVLVLAALSAAVAAGASARPVGGTPVALVTAETQNELLAVSLPDGRILRRVHLAPDPENVAAQVNGPAVVVSAKSHTVSILAWGSLHVLKTFRNFSNPHLAAIAPGGEWAYVTDDGNGLLSVIQLRSLRLVDRVYVGIGAHHLTFNPDAQQAWVALGERARTIVVLDTSRLNRPRIATRFHPATSAHAVAFSPDGAQVWITSDMSSNVTVYSARTHRALFRVAAGPPPQHLAFGQEIPDVYITSGYGSTIERVARDGHVIRRTSVPYGSFNVPSAGGLIVTSSLLSGTVTEFTDRLQRWQSVRVAPAARDVAIAVW